MASHHIKSIFCKGMAFDTELDGHHLITDSNLADGGNNSGPGPKRLMLVSLAGCTGIDVVSVLNKKRVSFSDFSIEIEAVLGEEYPKKYIEVKVTYHIRLPEDDQPKMEKAVKLSSEKYCGVMAMFKAFAKVNLQINYL